MYLSTKYCCPALVDCDDSDYVAPLTVGRAVRQRQVDELDLPLATALRHAVGRVTLDASRPVERSLERALAQRRPVGGDRERPHREVDGDGGADDPPRVRGEDGDDGDEEEGGDEARGEGGRHRPRQGPRPLGACRHQANVCTTTGTDKNTIICY